MNIVVQKADGKVYCRPDTSWDKENRDLYVPDFVSGYDYAPVVFARVSKAGRWIGANFASRYYDSVGYGVLLYISDLMPDYLYSASCSDHSSFLPYPLFNRYTLQEGCFTLYKNGVPLYSTEKGSEQIIEQALVNASKLVSLRIGDIVAIELQESAKLAGREEKTIVIKGEFCDNVTLENKVIF